MGTTILRHIMYRHLGQYGLYAHRPVRCMLLPWHLSANTGYFGADYMLSGYLHSGVVCVLSTDPCF